ncbi:hypothetical protein BCR33DRAFT_357704 [Rhizoclosmatium globosum]|uniref:Transmembrane protein n=1 Tax=Rhizoclosmatium globosum TaxID=329046 RepID=A0A1Y2C130_9FUNG|nr:hypothetical protein BCR33DRAFT_357704 [Rhizoclosmatium globosum]|eukprot:ORY40730.1 hypothetical protein BCR33DRAFT_357704 [Rhizoclosmatium globosum]
MEQRDSTIFLLSWAVPTVFFIVDIFADIWILYLILVIEPKHKGSSITPLSNLLLVSNLTLIGLLYFGTIYVAASAYYQYTNETSHIAYVIGWVSLGICCWCYLRFSWFRSKDVLRKHSHPILFAAFRYILVIYPIAQLAPLLKLVIPDSLPPSTKTAIFVGLVTFNGILLSFADTVMGFAFVAQINALRQTSTINQELSIISKFGLIGCCCVLLDVTLILICFICTLIDPMLESQELWSIYRVCWMLKDLLLNCNGLSLCIMKFALMKARTLRYTKENDLSIVISEGLVALERRESTVEGQQSSEGRQSQSGTDRRLSIADGRLIVPDGRLSTQRRFRNSMLLTPAMVVDRGFGPDKL